MPKETIMLSQDWDERKFVPGSFISQKLDGVPAKITRFDFGAVAVSRQGEVPKSIQHIMDEFIRLGYPTDIPIVGEVYIPGQFFKDISGKFRDHSPQPDLQFYIHDYLSDEPYSVRYERMLSLPTSDIIRNVYEMPNGLDNHQVFHLHEVQRAIDWVKTNEEIEGIVIRPPHSPVEPPGTRSWGIMKDKPIVTSDLAVASFEEALDTKTKQPLGMVGRINVHYKGGITGCGPGRLTHQERRDIWNDQQAYIGKIAEIHSMRDRSYDGLRQPTFQHWRPDKDEPDSR